MRFCALELSSKLDDSVNLGHVATPVVPVLGTSSCYWPVARYTTEETFINIYRRPPRTVGRLIPWLLWLGLVIGVGRYIDWLQKRRS